MNVKNTFGVGSQAIAISQYGSRVGFYACGFYGSQDTVYANVGTQVYLKGYIEVGPTFFFPYMRLTSESRGRQILFLGDWVKHISAGIPLLLMPQDG